MRCTHKRLDIMLSKDKKNIFEICAACNKLIAIYPWTDACSYKPYYIAMHLAFKDIFEFKDNGMYHIQFNRIFFSAKEDNAKSKVANERIATYTVAAKKPKFFSSDFT